MAEPVKKLSPGWLDELRDRSQKNARLLPTLDENPEVAKAARIAMFREQSEVPAKYQFASLGNFVQDDANRDAREAACAFVGRGFKGPGLGLHGPVGTGKTHLLCGIANAAIAAERRAIVITSTNLLLRLRESFSRRDVSEHQIIQRLVRVPVLILDDLGKESITPWSAADMFEFVNERYNAGLPIVVAANMSPAKLWADKYAFSPEGTDPNTMLSVLDKIREMTGEWVSVGGKSRRRGAA